jgi:hypothetical protein
MNFAGKRVAVIGTGAMPGLAIFRARPNIVSIG